MDSDSEVESLISSEDFSALESDSESEDDSLESVRNWTEIDISSQIPAPPRFPFTGNPGIQVNIATDDPLEFFELFFDESIISFIVEETNCYAEKYLESNQLTPSSRSFNWRETNINEMKCFLGLILLQGIVQKPVEKWYWSKRPILSTPFFGQVMSEQRYALLMKFLHFEKQHDNTKKDQLNSKLRKIYEIHGMIINKFKTVYIPNENISIDESLIAHKGLLGWKQYIPTKRARFGIKLYQLCESETGYIWNSIIYTGKGTNFMQEFDSYGLSTKSVLTLTL